MSDEKKRMVISVEVKSSLITNAVSFDNIDKIEINEYQDLILYRSSCIGKQTIKMCLADYTGRVTITID